MGIFKRFGNKDSQIIEGQIGFYGLADWWLSEFTEEEQRYIVERFRPMGTGADNNSRNLIKGKITSSTLPVTMFLNALAGWFKSKEDAHIAKRMYKKMEELGKLHPVDKPGNYQGRHYTTYLEEIKELKRSNSTEELERLLLGLIDAVEAQSRDDGLGLAPHYTEQLAILYRKQREYMKEIKILSRYIWATQKVDHPQINDGIAKRLQKAMLLAEKTSQKKG